MLGEGLVLSGNVSPSIKRELCGAGDGVLEPQGCNESGMPGSKGRTLPPPISVP